MLCCFFLLFVICYCALKIFEKYGKIGKVTILKDRHSRQSKGVAFVLFVDRNSAYSAIHATHGKELFGRTLKVCIAADNGRATEFIKRQTYKDKTRVASLVISATSVPRMHLGTGRSL